MKTTDRPTMVHVAHDAGVSLKTVSRVVNQVPSVDPALVEKVRASIKKLGFRRNDVAASLRSGGETSTIALVTADLSNAFYSTLSSSIAKVARDNGYHVMMASSEEDPELERTTALDLCQRRVSGLIIVPTSSDHSYLQTEVDMGIPVVFLDRPGTGLRADSVLIDNRRGAREATARLIQNGHRRIGILIDSLSIYTMRERLAGARDALDEAGIADDPGLLAENVHTPDDAVLAMRAMLTAPDAPTAAFCGNNRSTTGVVEEVWRQGVQVEIAGFDDFEMSRLLPQPVTIVDYDTTELGALATQTLIKRMQGDESAYGENFVHTSLVVRGGEWMSATA